MLHYITLCYIILHYVTLCYIILHYVTLCYIMLHYVTLCYIMLRGTRRRIWLRRFDSRNRYWNLSLTECFLPHLRKWVPEYLPDSQGHHILNHLNTVYIFTANSVRHQERNRWGLYWERYWNFTLHKMWWISWFLKNSVPNNHSTLHPFIQSVPQYTC